MRKQLTTGIAVFMTLLATARAGYVGWQHSGSIWILTTPEGANLPATATEENFPVLVRLGKDGFDFSKAKGGGEDIRFSDAAGTPLAYQIDEWDASVGTASIWVRIPLIKGNAHQEIKMLWGKPDALSESNGKAVFNESNGYVCVFHMSDPVTDEVGVLEAKDTGTTASKGMISEFYLDGAKGMVVSGSVAGNVVTLKLKDPSSAKKITYIKESNWSQDRLLIGANGIAALTFAEVEIVPIPATAPKK